VEAFIRHRGLVAPLDRVNVDTDQVIPKQFLKRIERTGYGEFLFYDWRFLEDGRLNPEFELNQPQFRGASILVAGQNFGCGSSREHAPWALQEFGFRAIIAPSFADIFFNNCFKNGLLPVVLDETRVAHLIKRAQSEPGLHLTVDLECQAVVSDDGWRSSFSVDAFRRHCLLNALDDIGLTLAHDSDIRRYEDRRPSLRRLDTTRVPG